jgi:uncharacterized protein YqeY
MQVNDFIDRKNFDMSLKQQIDADIKAAMLARDSAKLLVRGLASLFDAKRNIESICKNL